jgi:hypothetical protein
MDSDDKKSSGGRGPNRRSALCASNRREQPSIPSRLGTTETTSPNPSSLMEGEEEKITTGIAACALLAFCARNVGPSMTGTVGLAASAVRLVT